jgi:uncharacterized membrane protein
MKLPALTRSLPLLYLLLSLPLAATLCLLTPPFFVPDEAAHADREIQIGHGEWLAHRSTQGVGAPMDTGFLAVDGAFWHVQSALAARYPIAHTRPDGRISAAELAAQRSVRWSHRSTFESFQNTAVYPPLFYLPQAIGWRLGEAANLTILHSLLLARLLAALASIALGWLALRICATGRILLFVYLLLPTLLSLTASCSQDSLLLSAAALAMAIVSRSIASPSIASRALAAARQLTHAELWAAGTLLALCIAARPPYLPLAFILLLPSLDTSPIVWRSLRTPLLASLAVVAAVAAWLAAVHPLGTLILPGAAPALQLAYLRLHPIAGLATLSLGTVRRLTVFLFTGMDMLGVNDVTPPRLLYLPLAGSILALALLLPWNGLRRPTSRAVLAGLFCIIVAGISFIEYLIWTPPGAHLVDGLQARYYLPLVPFCLLLFRSRLPAAAPSPRRQVYVAIALAVFIAAVCTTPWLAAHRFYGVGLLRAFAIVLG